jgi:glycosyltransferase involved in cell wall biosynthesis
MISPEEHKKLQTHRENNNPRVTVLMPAYNCEEYVRDAIDSILNQSFTDFEFLIINDGSTDKTKEIVISYHDTRIRYMENEFNIGIVATLNKGAELARGELIARMDADDVSLPKRLKLQVEFMDNNPEVGVVGTWARLIDKKGSILGRVCKASGKVLEARYWMPSPIIHPSAVIRRPLLLANLYRPHAWHSEDYDLWLRMVKSARINNVQRFLLFYRVHPESVSLKNVNEQVKNTYFVFKEHTGLDISFEEFKIVCFPILRYRLIKRYFLLAKFNKLLNGKYLDFLQGDIMRFADIVYNGLLRRSLNLRKLLKRQKVAEKCAE